MRSITSSEEFHQILSANKYVFVDFYADWCGPCRMIAPYVESLSQSNGHIAFVKVNVDLAQNLAREYEVSAMPTFLTFADGKKVHQIVGANKGEIDRAIASML